ncbi:MAG: phytoene/squalene synthase family protein [Paracoccaceae bacterium]
MSFAACAEIVRRGDPDRFLSAMTARPRDRGRLLALYAFNLEVARAPWVTTEETLAEMRLQWWADTLAEIFDGKPPRRHEVVTPLAETIGEAGLPRPLFDGLIAARRFDIHRRGHADRAAFDAYIEATSGNLMQLAALSLGAPESALPVIADFAYGAGVSNLLRALPRLYAAGRDPIPVAGGGHLAAAARGEVSADLRHALREICTEAEVRIRQARGRRRRVPRRARSALLAGWRVMGPLEVERRRPETLLTASFETSEFRRRASLILRSLSGHW